VEVVELSTHQVLVLESLQWLPSNKTFLYSRGLATNLRCPRCEVEAEDLDHLPFQCTWSLEVWQALEADCGLASGSLQSNTWREHLRMTGRSKDGNVRSRLCITLYAACEKQRNCWVFKQE